MVRIVSENSEIWTMQKIRSLVDMEATVLKKQLSNIQEKLAAFEKQYGKKSTEELYGQVDDMELLEWEGEIETKERLQKKLTALEQIIFQYE